jgi:hypothetical protein
MIQIFIGNAHSFLVGVITLGFFRQRVIFVFGHIYLGGVDDLLSRLTAWRITDVGHATLVRLGAVRKVTDSRDECAMS